MARPPSNATRWKERAEIDYLGPFVKAWAGFNAWYRAETNQRQDKVGLEYVKSHANQIRARILPLINPTRLDRNDNPIPETEDAERFRLLVWQLHSKLEEHAFEVYVKDQLEAISFRAVCLSPGGNLPPIKQHRQHEYVASKTATEWTITVRRRGGGAIVQAITLDQFDEAAFMAHAGYIAISPEQRAHALAQFQLCNPRPMIDLMNAGGEPIAIGNLNFRCTREQLFCGIVEIIYAMRNALLHGEIQPSQDVLELYEPAYRIVMRFLECIRD
jgi:hypothetical protein